VGELSELRVRDLNFHSQVLTVSRAVVEVNPKFHPQSERFFVKDYPKGKEYRRFKLSAQIVEKLKVHRDAEKLGPDDLLFVIRNQENWKPMLRVAPNPDELGLTPPNEKGWQYKHGTLSGYGAGKCHRPTRHQACAVEGRRRRRLACRCLGRKSRPGQRFRDCFHIFGGSLRIRRWISSELVRSATIPVAPASRSSSTLVFPLATPITRTPAVAPASTSLGVSPISTVFLLPKVIPVRADARLCAIATSSARSLWSSP
jgi:hypothetical protein